MDDPSLDLAGLTRRFAESEQALTAVRSRLEALATAEENAAAATGSLETAAGAVKDFVDAAHEVTEQLSATVAEAKVLLEAGSDLLKGNDLTELREAIEQLRSANDGRFNQLEERLASVDAVERERRLVERQLAHVKANVSPRHIRKALETLPTEGNDVQARGAS
jgi:DNA repair exonuclease SbcCD ATPase subunit